MTRTVVYFVDGAAFGGTEQVVSHLMTGIDRNRWEPVLSCYPEPGLAELEERAQRLGVEVWTVPRWGRYRSLPEMLRWAAALRRRDVAVFHAHLNHPYACRYALLAAGLARVPAVIATNHLFVDVPLTTVDRARQRLVARAVDRYLAVSQAVADRMVRSFPFLRPTLGVIHNGIPTAPFALPVDPRLRADLSGGTDGPIILTVARLDAQKGLPDLIAAAGSVPEARFVIAGDGPDRVDLERLSAALGVGDRVVFLGHRRDVPALLAASDAFVLPSRNEGLPLSILEALAAGRPTIATNVGGTSEAIRDGETGFLIPAGSPDRLAAGIRRVLDNPEAAGRMAVRGRELVEREFSVGTMVERTTAVYEAVLAGGDPG